MTDVHMLILDSKADADRLHEFRRQLGDIWGTCRSLQSVVVRARLVTVPGVERGPALEANFNDHGQVLFERYGWMELGDAALCRLRNWDALCDERDAAMARIASLEAEVADHETARKTTERAVGGHGGLVDVWVADKQRADAAEQRCRELEAELKMARRHAVREWGKYNGSLARLPDWLKRYRKEEGDG